MRALLSPKQVAQAIGVSESSLKRWCDKGLLELQRTAGGHRRLALNSVVQFLRETGQPLTHPELLGLPVASARIEATLERTREPFAQALIAGDEARCRRLLLDHYLAGQMVAELCDRLIAPVFQEIGAAWEHGSAEVYQERRAIEISLHLLYELRMMLPSIDPLAQHAIGATLSGDPYKLPTTMCELALREAGWRAESYGVDLPVATLRSAIESIRPRLFWLSVSAIRDRDEFLSDYAMLYETALRHDVAIAVGGRALTDEIRREMKYSAYCDQLSHLLAFANGLSGEKLPAKPD